MLVAGRWPRSRLRAGIVFRRAISNRFCRRSCAQGILRGVRGPRGGYELARSESDIGADEILRAAGTVEDNDDTPLADSALLRTVVVPALERAEETFSEALARITVADLAKSADGGRKPAAIDRWQIATSAGMIEAKPVFGRSCSMQGYPSMSLRSIQATMRPPECSAERPAVLHAVPPGTNARPCG